MLVAMAAFAGSIAAGVVILAGCRRMLDSAVPRVANYAGREVPTAAGFLFVPVFLLVYVMVNVFDDFPSGKAFGPAQSLLVLVLGMCFLGLVDDVMGDSEVSGFKGHLLSAFKGRLTTGFLKALGGFLVALAASLPFSSNLGELLLNGSLIALCANLFNLLDTRPGRALKVFIPVLAGVVALNWSMMDSLVAYLLSIGAVALVLIPGDLSGRFMLGDAGSNVLGATAGLGVVVGLVNWWKLGILGLLLIITFISEIYSFSRIVSSNRVLNWIDLLGRKGEVSDQERYN